MSLTTTSQEWLTGTGARGAAATVTRRHIAAETSTDVDAICATIASDVFFAVPVRTRAGQELRQGTVLSGPEQVRSYYEGRSGSYVVRESAQVKSITTDWYVFNESAALLLGTGMVGEVDATGKEWTVNSAVLFPAAPDGIRGEICATRLPMDDVIRGTLPTAPAARSSLDAERAHGALLDRFAQAVRTGDWAAAAAEMSDGHTLAVRIDPLNTAPAVHSATGRDQSVASLPAIFGGAEDLTLMVRIATEWYVFAEYLIELRGATRRVALTQPVEGGKVIGTFGYGRDEP
ncbi:MAG TPA: hypothetical protein VMU14_15585 [Acidimicrobiales bacterium]|nr:hypothetical protein [Acidimicrobiales bacterium]